MINSDIKKTPETKEFPLFQGDFHMAEKEGFEPSKLPLFKGVSAIGLRLVCALSEFYPHFPFRSGQEDMRRRDRGRTVLILLCVPSPVQKSTRIDKQSVHH